MTFSNIYGTASFWTKIFITLCIMLIMLIISAILIWLFSTSFSNILSQSDILVGSMSIQCIFLFISTAVVAAGLFSSHPFSYLKMDKRPSVTALIGVIICMIVFIPFMTFAASSTALDFSMPDNVKYSSNKSKHSPCFSTDGVRLAYPSRTHKAVYVRCRL